jgi:hypothetical protein
VPPNRLALVAIVFAACNASEPFADDVAATQVTQRVLVVEDLKIGLTGNRLGSEREAKTVGGLGSTYLVARVLDIRLQQVHCIYTQKARIST